MNLLPRPGSLVESLVKEVYTQPGDKRNLGGERCFLPENAVFLVVYIQLEHFPSTLGDAHKMLVVSSCGTVGWTWSSWLKQVLLYA